MYSSILLDIVTRELRDTGYDQRESRFPDNIISTCLYWSKYCLIVDILQDEDECCITSKQLSCIYAYYEDDVEEVAMEIVGLLKNIINDPKNNKILSL